MQDMFSLGALEVLLNAKKIFIFKFKGVLRSNRPGFQLLLCPSDTDTGHAGWNDALHYSHRRSQDSFPYPWGAMGASYHSHVAITKMPFMCIPAVMILFPCVTVQNIVPMCYFHCNIISVHYCMTLFLCYGHMTPFLCSNTMIADVGIARATMQTGR